MTNALTIFNQLRPHTIGYDSIFDHFNDMFESSGLQTNYPPYNIRKGAEEDSYIIELALAGFSEEDVTVSVKESNLTVSGELSDKDNGFVHQGISQRKFSKNFVLADDVVVKGADLSNGILSIYAERVVPEEKKARTIEIGKVSKSTKKQFLSE